MKNKLTDNDPRLTAYALGELSRDKAEEITDALALGENIALKREVEGIDSLGIMLSQTLSGSSVTAVGAKDPQIKLRASQRDAIFRSAKAPTVDDVRSANQSRWFRPMIVTLSAAALVTVSLMILNNVDSNEPNIVSLPDASSSILSEDKIQSPILPSDKAWDVSSSNPSQLEDSRWVNRADSSVTRIPLVCGKASWSWIQKSILEKGSVPSNNAVRVEEIVNTFDYDIPSDLDLKYASASADVVRCPWNNDHLIAVILVRNKYQENIQIETAVSFSENVNQYRILGYGQSKNPDENVISPAMVTMASQDSHMVMYEIIPEAGIENAADVLSLDIRTAAIEGGELANDAKTLDLQFSDRAWTKSNQGMQFALILTTWSKLISQSEHSSTMSTHEVEKMITEFTDKFEASEQQLEAIEVLRGGINLL